MTETLVQTERCSQCKAVMLPGEGHTQHEPQCATVFTDNIEDCDCTYKANPVDVCEACCNVCQPPVPQRQPVSYFRQALALLNRCVNEQGIRPYIRTEIEDFLKQVTS